MRKNKIIATNFQFATVPEMARKLNTSAGVVRVLLSNRKIGAAGLGPDGAVYLKTAFDLIRADHLMRQDNITQARRQAWVLPRGCGKAVKTMADHAYFPGADFILSQHGVGV